MLKKTKHTKLIVLIDPDKFNPQLVEIVDSCHVAYIFVGGSSIKKKKSFESTIHTIKSTTNIPLVIFPGDETQISKNADGILLLSLLSGNNPDYLIGKHVLAAKKIKNSKLNVIPTGYILINGGKTSTTEKITKTKGLSNRTDIINTCIAAELLGKHLVYIESGSGASKTADVKLITAIKSNINIPLIIGGGIDTVAKAKKILSAKPDYIVVGNAFEKKPELLIELSKLFK